MEQKILKIDLRVNAIPISILDDFFIEKQMDSKILMELQGA